MRQTQSPAAKAIMEFKEPTITPPGRVRPLVGLGKHKHDYVPKQGLYTGRLLWICQNDNCPKLVDKWGEMPL